MSLPSFQLSKNAGGVWICSGAMPGSGRPFNFEAGTGSRDKATGFAEQKLRAKVASSTGSRARWARWKQQKADGTAPPNSGPPNTTKPPAAAAAAPAAPPRPSDDELRAKLLGLGDAQPIEPDEVISAGSDGEPAGAGAGDDEEPAEFDSEGQELIASLLAKGATLGIVGLVNRRLRKRKPPQEGEAHEYGLERFHDGIETIAKKLVGRTATLGPVGQIFVGGLVIVGSMYMSAEPIDGAASAASSPAPAPAPEAPHVEPQATTNGANHAPPPPAETALAPRALGVFGVEKRTLGN